MKTFALAIFFSLALVGIAHADAPVQNGASQPTAPVQPGASQPSSNGVTLINPLAGSCSSGQNCLESFLKAILALVTRIGTVVVILMLVYVGFMFATAQGNESKIEHAKEALLWTVVGALILLGAQAIASGIEATANSLSTGA